MSGRRIRALKELSKHDGEELTWKQIADIIGYSRKTYWHDIKFPISVVDYGPPFIFSINVNGEETKSIKP